MERYDWLRHRSEVPFWEVELPGLPYQKMYEEAVALKKLFVDHRANDPTQMGASHQGWASLTVHGISSQHTMNWEGFMLDLCNRQSVWNRSEEDRIHLIVHWRLPQLHEPKGREWMEFEVSAVAG